MKHKAALLTWVTTGLTVIASGSMTSAQAANTGFSITPGIGFYKFDDDYDLEDKGFANIGLQYEFENNIALEASWGQSDTEQDNGPIDDIDWNYTHIDALYYFDAGDRIRPYLAIGAGEGELKINSQTTDETLVNVGGGLKYLFGNAFAMRADLRAINSQDNETTSGLATIALSYLFGADSESSTTTPDFEISQAESLDTDEDGIADAIDRCINTPVGITVDTSGCALDSDLDGIADYQDQCINTPDNVRVDNEGCPQDLDKDGIADYQDRCLNTSIGSLVDQQGCAVRISDIAPTLSDLAFTSGSSEMNEEYITELKSLATFLQRYQNTVAVIEGHTDSTGDAQFNAELSEKRAASIRKVLIEQFGIDPSRLKAVGYGESRPIASNITKEGRAKNRRVDTKIETSQ